MAIVFGSPLENDADAFGPGANYEGDGVDNNFSGLAASASSAAPLVTTAFPFITNNGTSGSVGGGDVASMSSARRRNNTSSSTGTGRHTSSGRAGGASGRTDHHRRRRHHHGSSSGLLADVHDDEESTGSSSNSSSSDTHEFGDSRSSSTGPDECGEHGVEHQTTISGSSYYNPAAAVARSGPQHHHHSSSAATGTTVAHVHHVGSMEDQQQRTTTLGLLQPTLSVVADDFDDGQLATTSSFASRASQMQQAGGGPLPPAGLQPQRTTSSQGLLGVVGITGSPHAYHQGGGGSGESGAGMSDIRRTSSNSSMLHSPPPSLQALVASPSGALQPARSHRSSLLTSRSDDFAVRSPPVAPIGASAHNNVAGGAGAAAAATGSGVFHNGPLVSVEDYTTTTTDSSTRASVRLTAAGAASTWEEELQLTRNQPQQHSVDELIARTLREEAVMDDDDDMTTGGRGQVPNSSDNGLHRSPSGRRQQQQQQYHHGGAGLTLHASSGSFGASAPPSNTSVQLAPPTRIPSAHSNTGGWGLMGSSATSGGGSFLESNPAGHSTLITEDHAIQPLTNSAHSAHHHHHQQQQQPLANNTLVSSLASESAPSPTLLHLPQMQHHQNHSTTSGNDAASSSMLPSSGRMVSTFHASTTTSLASPSHDSSPRMFLQGSSMPPSHGGTSLQTQRGRGLLDDPEVHMGGSSAMTPSSFGGGGPHGEWGSTQTNPRSPTPTSNSQSSSPRHRHEQQHHRSSASIDTSRPLPITTRKDENHPLSEGSTTDEEMRRAPQQHQQQQQQQQQHITPRPPLLCLPQESILVIFSYLGTSSLLLRGTCAYLNEYFLHVALDRLKPVLQPSPFSWAMLRSTNEVQRTDRIRRVQRTLSHHRKLARTMKERIFGRKHTQLPQPQLAASGSRMGLPSAVFDPWQLQQTAGGTTHLNAPHMHRSSVSDISSTALLSSAMQPLPGGGVQPSPFAALMNGGGGHQQRSASPPSTTVLPSHHEQHHQHHHPVSRNPLMLPIHHHSNNSGNPHSSDSAISLGPFVSSPTTTARRDSSAMMMVPVTVADSSATQQLHAVPLMIPPLTVVVGGSAQSSASEALGGSGVQQPPQMQQPPFSSLIMTEAKHFLDVPAATSRFMRPRSGSDVENSVTAQQQQQRQLQQKAAVAAALEAVRQRREREEKKIRHKLKRQLATRQWLQELVIARRVKANVSRALFDSVTIEKQSHAPPIILPNGTICFSRWHLVAVFVRTTEADPKSDGLPAPNSSRWIKTGYLGSHTDTVTGMRFEPRLQCLFTSSFDGSIKRWNLRGAGSDGRATACRSDPTTATSSSKKRKNAAETAQADPDDQQEGLFLCQASYKVTVAAAMPVFPIFSFDIVHLKNYHLTASDKQPFTVPPPVRFSPVSGSGGQRRGGSQRHFGGSHNSWGPGLESLPQNSVSMLAGELPPPHTTTTTGGQQHASSASRLQSPSPPLSRQHRNSLGHNNMLPMRNINGIAVNGGDTGSDRRTSAASPSSAPDRVLQSGGGGGDAASETSTQILFADDLLRHAMNPHRTSTATGNRGGGTQWGPNTTGATGTLQRHQSLMSHSNATFPSSQHQQLPHYHPEGSTIGILNEDSSLIGCGSEFGSVALMHVDAFHSATLGIATVADTRVRQIKFLNSVIFEDVPPSSSSPSGGPTSGGISAGAGNNNGNYYSGPGGNNSATAAATAAAASGNGVPRENHEMMQQGIVYIVVSTFNGVFLLSHVIFRKVCVVMRNGNETTNMPTVSTNAVPPGQLLSEDPVHARKGYHYFSTSLSMRRVHFFTMMELPQCIDCPRPWWHRDPAHDFDVRSDGSHSAGGTLSFNRVAAYAMAESQLRGGGTGADDAAAFTTAASSFQRQTSVSDDSTDAHPFFTKPLILLVCRRMPCGLVTINPQYRHPDVSGPDADNAQPLNADHPSNRPVLERQLPFNLGAVSCAKLSPSNAFIVVALESGRIVFVSPRISSLAIRQRPPVNPPFHFSEPLLNRVPATTITTAGTHRASLRTAGRPARAVSTNDAQPATARASHPSSAASASANAHHEAHHFDEADDSVASLHPTSTTGPAAAASADNHATNATTTTDEDPLHHSESLVEESTRSQTGEFLQQHSDSVAAATDAQPLPTRRRFAPPPPAPRNVGEDEEEDDTDVFDDDDDDEDEDLNEEAQEERRLRISSSAGSTPPASHYGLERPPPADVDTDAASTGSRWSTLRGVSPLPQPVVETTEHFDEVRNFFGSHVFEDPLIKRWQRKNDGVSWDMLHMTTQNDRNSVLLHTTVLFHPTVEHTFLQVANMELDGWKLSTVDTQATVMVFNIETLVHLFTVTLYPVAHHHLPMSRLLVRAISAETSSRPINPKYVVWNNGTMLVSPLPITSHTVVLDFSGQFRVHEELVPIHEVALGRTDEQIAERLRRQKRHGRGTGARRGVGDDASEFPELPVFRPVRQRARPGQATANGASAAAAVDSTLNNTVSGGGRQQLRTSTALEFVQSSGNISHHAGGPGGGQVTTGRRPQHAATTRGAARRQQTLAALRSNPQTSIAIGDGDGQDLAVDDDIYDADDICSKGSDCSSNDSGEDDERLSKVADSEQWLLVNVRYLAKLFGNYGGDSSTYRQWWNARESVLAKIIPLQEFPLMFHVLYIFAPPLVMVMISVILFLVAMRLDEVVSYPFLFPFSLHCLLVPHYFGINVYSYKPLLAHHSGFTFYMRMFADALYLLVFPLIFVLRRDGEFMTNISWMVLSAPISIAIVLAFLAARLEDRFELRHHIALDPAGAAQRYRHITGMQAAQTVLVVTFITAISSFFDDPLDDRSVNLAVLVSSAWRDKAMFDPLDTSPDYTMTSLIFIVFTPIWIFTIMYSVHVHTVVPPPVLTNDNPSDDSSGDDDDHLMHAGQQHMNARSVLRRWLRRFSRCTRYARRVTVYGASILFLHVLYATVVLVPLVGFCLRYDRYVMCSMHPYGVPVLLNTSVPSPTNSTNISFTITTTLAPTNGNSSSSFSGNDTSSSSSSTAAVGQYVMVAVACGSSDFPLYFVLSPVIFSLILVAGFATSNVIVHVRQLRRGM